MNTYLLPTCDTVSLDTTVKKVVARNLEEAQDKFITLFTNAHNIDYPADFEELFDNLLDIGIIIGDIYNLEEFT